VQEKKGQPQRGDVPVPVDDQSPSAVPTCQEVHHSINAQGTAPLGDVFRVRYGGNVVEDIAQGFSHAFRQGQEALFPDGLGQLAVRDAGLRGTAVRVDREFGV
jgi:hypothetical protein